MGRITDDIITKYKKYITIQKHPKYDLRIINYTQEVQFGKLWDDFLLMARGLIIDSDGKIIAKGFNKFFNLEELDINDIPNEPFEIFEKMDGSLGIYFYYNDEWIMATRGSFTSDQAIKGKQIADKYLKNVCVPGFVYLFEIIYPENRIVVDYNNDERLVLLSIIDPDGNEIPYDDILFDGWDIVNKYDGFKDYKTLKNIIPNNAEGFVVRFKNGFRMKIKGEEYVRLHKVMTGLSNKLIWEHLKNDTISSLLELIPDESFDRVKGELYKFKTQWSNLYNNYVSIYSHIQTLNLTRKEFAYLVKQFKHPQILFAMLDNKNFEPMLWDIIKPQEFKRL